MKIIAAALAALLLCGHGTALSPLSRTPPVHERDQVLFSEEEAEIDPSNGHTKHENRRLLRSEGRNTSGPNSKSSLEASLGQGVQNNGYKFRAQKHESFVKHSTTRRLVQDWVHVATLTSYSPAIVSETEIEACDDCKLSDDDINSLDFSVLKFEPKASSASHPITYFDFSNKIFESTAVVQPCSTPWTLSDTEALAGTFGGQETCCLYTVCNFGRGHCSGTVKSSYGYQGSGGCGSPPVVGTSGASYGSGVRIYVWSLPFGTTPPTTSPTSSPITRSPTTSPTTSLPTLSPTHSPSSSPTYTPRLAKYIKIQLASSGSLSVNEVQVINESSTNVAASSATMSSTDGGNVPANAVDGDTNTAARTLDELMPWLQIELAQGTEISKVIIDPDSELSSARISLLDEEGKTVFAAEGSVLAAATNGSGALEINGPDFQNAETSSPSSSPTMSANLVTDGLENSLYYPDWTKGNGGCKTGGGQPLYMTNAPTTWMFATLNNCCERYYGWMLDECKGTSGGAPSGLWYPDWAGPDDTCKNDGSEPQYMDLNPVAWMHSSKQACCDANFGWMLNECLGSSGPNADANKWFIDWDDYKCKRDCAVGTGTSCGGHAESWDELFDTQPACCAKKASWNPTCIDD